MLRWARSTSKTKAGVPGTTDEIGGLVDRHHSASLADLETARCAVQGRYMALLVTKPLTLLRDFSKLRGSLRRASTSVSTVLSAPEPVRVGANARGMPDVQCSAPKYSNQAASRRRIPFTKVRLFGCSGCMAEHQGHVHESVFTVGRLSITTSELAAPL